MVSSYALIILFSIILIGTLSLFIALMIRDKIKKSKEEEEEIGNMTQEAYEEERGIIKEESLDENKSLIDMMLKYHKNKLLNVVGIKSLNDLDYVVLTHLTSLFENTSFKQFPFWTILHAEEAKHSLNMLKNALQNIREEEYAINRDIIFAWLNYVFDIDDDIIQNREYIKKEDLINIIDSLLK